MKAKLDKVLADKTKLYEVMLPFFNQRNKLNSELSKITHKVESYVIDSFDKEFEEEIDNYERSSPLHSDVHIDFKEGTVCVCSDNPRTNHPYDSFDKEYNLNEVLEKLTLDSPPTL